MEDTLLQAKDLIKQRRESLGLTQKEFAYLLNLKDSERCFVNKHKVYQAHQILNFLKIFDLFHELAQQYN